MFIIDEENHGSLAVANNPLKAIKWLLDEDWLGPLSEAILPDDTEIPMWRYIGFTSKKSCTNEAICSFFAKFNTEQLKEELEKFGFYFSEITVVD